jgi:hypothetical protein
MPAAQVLLHPVDGVRNLADVPEALHATLLVALIKPGLFAGDSLDEPRLDALHECDHVRGRNEPKEGAAHPEALGRQPVRRIVREFADFLQRSFLALQAAEETLHEQHGQQGIVPLQKPSQVVLVDHIEHTRLLVLRVPQHARGMTGPLRARTHVPASQHDRIL